MRSATKSFTARAAERELSDRQRLDGMRAEVREHIHRGREALTRQECQAARGHLTVAVAQARAVR